MQHRKKIKSVAAALLALPALAWSAASVTEYTFTRIPAPDEPNAMPLYAGVAPGSEGQTQREVWSSVMNERVVRNVTRPTITPFLPEPGKATGAAVIVAPGGAYLMLAMDNEGWPVARKLAEEGIAAFVLKYRLDPSPDDEGEFMKVAAARFGAAAKAGADRVPPIRQPLAVDDAIAAIKMVRSRAKEWGIDPKRVGVLGFSAGAMTALQASLREDAAALPDFVGLIYGPMTPVNVNEHTPPAFIAIAGDDPLFGNSGFGIVESWKAAKRPVELHYYERGDHGFGTRTQHLTSDLWFSQFVAWLRARGLLQREP